MSAPAKLALFALGFVFGAFISASYCAPETNCCHIRPEPTHQAPSITQTPDGRAHLAYSVAGSAAISAAFDDPRIGFGVMFAAGLAKEIWDSKHPGHDASWADLRSDLYGSLIGAAGYDLGNCALRGRGFVCNWRF